MIKKGAGFALVELLVTMAIFLLTISAASSVFVPLLTQCKQQSRITESNIEGILGLEILRRDVEHAGFGLPWEIPEGLTYFEAANPPGSDFNEVTASGTTDPPRAIQSGNDVNYPDIVKGSDYLVIKATNVAINEAATKWADISNDGSRIYVKSWASTADDLNAGDRVIVLVLSKGENGQRILKTSDNNNRNFTVQFNQSSFSKEFSPLQGETYLIYGVTGPANPATKPLMMPFNRADYYVSNRNVPQRCAPRTGVLRKALLNHSGTYQGGIHPLLDCVADMQVIYGFDKDADGDFEPGSGDEYINSLARFTAQEIREQVKEVKIFILAHEGQKDVNYRYSNDTISVGGALGRNFSLSTIPNYQNYRWKVYTIVVKPHNLR
ncbi:MAG: hypothetical protein AB1390_01425 [Nitrospirota bacterium]